MDGKFLTIGKDGMNLDSDIKIDIGQVRRNIKKKIEG